MSKVSCTKSLSWDMAHRLYKHEGRCCAIHGHRYTAEFTLVADALDSCGRVLDFSTVKSSIGNWINEYWDHALLLYEADAELLPIFAQLPSHLKERVRVLPCNPTAENMASYLLEVVCPAVLQDLKVKVIRVTVWETPTSSATATLQ